MGSSVFKIAGVLAGNDPDLSLGPQKLRSSLAIEVMKVSLSCETDGWMQNVSNICCSKAKSEGLLSHLPNRNQNS